MGRLGPVEVVFAVFGVACIIGLVKWISGK
jgi:hypothetical protein